MRCYGSLLHRVQGRRPFMLLAMTVMTVLFIHLLVHREVVDPFALIRLRAGVGEDLLGQEALQVTFQSPVTTLPRQDTPKKESKAKKQPPKKTTQKRKPKVDPLKNNTVLLTKWPPKVKYPLMMFQNPGRLGNRLNSYATSLRFQAVHKGNATVATSRDTVQRLMELLDPTFLPLPVAEKSLVEKAKEKKAFVAVGPNWAKSDFVTHLEPTFQKAEKKFHKNHKPKLYSLGGYPNRMWLLAGHHDTIRAAYRIREDLRQKAARFLEGVRQKRGRQDITFVGFHIRRTDYTKVIKTYYKCSLPGPAYYESALNYYRNKLQNPVFVVASDSPAYARQHLGDNEDVEFSDMKSPAEDMALLGSCSHSIMTVGSYGFWASFFAGGEVVYPLGVNCTVTPFVHPDTLGPRGYENFKPFDMEGGGPV